MKKILLVLISALAVLVAQHARAEKADSTKPMEIKAVNSQGNIQSGDAVMENFVGTQGSRILKADKAVVKQDKDRNIALTLTGKDVTFREKRDNNEGWLDARADRLEYDGKNSTVKLIGKARIETDGNTLDGELITYNLDTGAYNVSGTGAQQVRAVLLPAKKDSKDAPKATTKQ